LALAMVMVRWVAILVSVKVSALAVSIVKADIVVQTVDMDR